jgi:hypothetical protein
MPLNPNALVVRPGDPRMGGALCRRCGGDGLMMGPFFIDEVRILLLLLLALLC